MSRVDEYQDRVFSQLCRDYPDWRLERTDGEIRMMTPAGADSSERESKLNYQLVAWSEANGLGHVYSSSVGFRLPNGSILSPDASWIAQERWVSLSRRERRGFPHICPDFVAELLSPSDRLPVIQAKLHEFIEQGARLGWLIDPDRRVVEIYRPGQPVDVLVDPPTLSGEDVLPGFVFSLTGIFGDY